MSQHQYFLFVLLQEKFFKFGYGSGADEEDDVIEDDYSEAHRVESDANPYGAVGTRGATIKWWQRTQLEKLVKATGRDLYEWFHGIIPRGYVIMDADFLMSISRSLYVI